VLSKDITSNKGITLRNFRCKYKGKWQGCVLYEAKNRTVSVSSGLVKIKDPQFSIEESLITKNPICSGHTFGELPCVNPTTNSTFRQQNHVYKDLNKTECQPILRQCLLKAYNHPTLPRLPGFPESAI
jgi:hypothetical protein